MKYLLVVACAAFTLAGCAGSTSLPKGFTVVDLPAPLMCDSNVSTESRIRLEKVDDLIEQQSNHAALAELLSSEMETSEHWLRYAKLQALIGNLSRAETVYENLAYQCGTVRAWHGLGVVELKRKHFIDGIVHLEKAAQLMPSDSSARNDYGFGLLMVSDYPQAIFELKTALELNNGNGAARINLAAAYLLDDNEAGISELERRYDLTDEELDYARELVTTLGRVGPLAQ